MPDCAPVWAESSPARSAPFVVKARGLGLRAGIDPAGFNKLADDLEVDAFLEKHRRAKKT